MVSQIPSVHPDAFYREWRLSGPAPSHTALRGMERRGGQAGPELQQKASGQRETFMDCCSELVGDGPSAQVVPASLQVK